VLTVLLYILVMLLLMLLVLVIFATTRPNEFTIRRSISIAATPERVFALINDFREWPKWSPWEKLDPTMKKTLSGAESGPGSVYEWEGDKKVGAGRMEILAAAPFSTIDIQLSFFRPFRAENRTLFTLLPQSEGTYVTWEMSGTNNLIMKMMGIVMNMDKVIGRDFEKGLGAMKAEAEKNQNQN
jgi:uncharacterized protein YndB with AHSA1/START domain